MEKLEMTARQIPRVRESLRLEWLLCPLNLEKKNWRVTKLKYISNKSNSSSNEFQCFHHDS